MFIYLALILSACASLVYQITSIDILFYYFTKSSYSVSTVIGIFLLGLGIGSFLIHKINIKKKKLTLGLIQIFIAIYGVLVLYNLESLLPSLSNLGLFITSSIILLVPTIGLGASFPLFYSILKERKENIGLVYSLDLIGAVLGSFLAGFFLIPELGNKITILVASGISLISGYLIIPKKYYWIFICSMVLGLVLSPLIVQEVQQNQTFSKPSAYGLIEIGEDLCLNIDKRCQCTFLDYANKRERLIANTALNYSRGKVLNIGLGCGRVLELLEDKVEITTIEINEVVIEANDFMNKKYKTPIKIEDGFLTLKNSKDEYDLIIIDIDNPEIYYTANIFTVEAFEYAKESLKEDGTLLVWTFPCEEEYHNIIFNSLKKPFNYVYLKDNQIFIATDNRLNLEEYVSNSTQLNTLDKKVLGKIYTRECL